MSAPTPPGLESREPRKPREPPRIGGLDEPEPQHERHEIALSCALFAAGWLVFDYPLLSLWVGDATLFGVPLLPAALFAAWGAIIAALAWIAERNEG